MKTALEGLVTLLTCKSKFKSKLELKLILYVDECQKLTTIKLANGEKNRTMLDFLAYAVDQCRDYRLVGVFLSTNTILSHVSFPSNVVPSAREVNHGSNVRPAPFVQLSFDCWKNSEPIIHESKMSMFQVCTIRFLARFGRPL